jgi:hypothetical protein
MIHRCKFGKTQDLLSDSKWGWNLCRRPRESIFVEQINAPERNPKAAKNCYAASSRSLAIAFALVIVVVLAPPGTDAPSDGTTRMPWISGFGSRSFEARGSVEFAEDDRDVKTHFSGRLHLE